MLDKRHVGVDPDKDADNGGVRLAACAGALGAAIVGKRLRLKVCMCPGAPVSMREYPLPRGRIVAIGLNPVLSLAMANGDFMMWSDTRWVKCYNLADEEHDS